VTINVVDTLGNAITHGYLVLPRLRKKYNLDSNGETEIPCMPNLYNIVQLHALGYEITNNLVPFAPDIIKHTMVAKKYKGKTARVKFTVSDGSTPIEGAELSSNPQYQWLYISGPDGKIEVETLDIINDNYFVFIAPNYKALATKLPLNTPESVHEIILETGYSGYYTVFTNSKGGKLLGDTYQKVEIDGIAKMVTPVPFLGYYFYGWLDKTGDLITRDINHQFKGFTYYALFKPIKKPTATQQTTADILSVYPNPVFNNCLITCTNMNRIQVFRIDGGLVLDKTTLTNKINIDFNQEATGIYLLKAYTVNGDVLTTKIIKK